jgi:hypothetical protein
MHTKAKKELTLHESNPTCFVKGFHPLLLRIPVATTNTGKYLVMPTPKWYHDIICQKIKFQFSKKFKKYISANNMCVYNPYNFKNEIKTHIEKQKRQKIDMWIGSFVVLSFLTLFMLDLLFLFLCSCFKFGTENFRGYKTLILWTLTILQRAGTPLQILRT